jgi:proline iminopeptidase
VKYPSTFKIANQVDISRRWAGAEKFVLAGGSYGGFISLDYAILHGDRLLGLILRDTWAEGVLGMMTALANVLTSDRLNVDVARQIRLWSGHLVDDEDFEASIQEIVPIFAPPEALTASGKKKVVVKELQFEGLVKTSARSGYNSATQNAAFSINVPRFDVRHRLKDIKVWRSGQSPSSQPYS